MSSSAGDSAGRNTQIKALRKRAAKLNNGNAIFGKLNPVQERILAASDAYGKFRRVQNEGEIEALKAQLASYIFDPSVVIRGVQEDKDGGVRVVEVSKFDAMMKAARLYLDTMNLQNKMWHLYTEPNANSQLDVASMINVKNLSVSMTQELQKIARKELPVPVDAVIVDNEEHK